ncbi:radical SAM protein [Candidatus Pacearchaeota archaeon]|nr:radical SAM protein [Candidatus Pacearchaeota archaeon]
MEMSIEDVAEEARSFVLDNIVPVFTKEGNLRVPVERYQFLVRNDTRGSSAEPRIILNAVYDSLQPESVIGTYVHMPVCNYRCKFCTFPVVLNKGKTETDKYSGLLVRELKTFLENYPRLKGRNITSLYFGGGTPTTLSPPAIGTLVKKYTDSFDVSGADITMEGSPESIVEDPERLIAARDAGVNRFSFGIQTFDDNILKLCDRRHTAEQTEKAFCHVNSCGFRETINDLMRGLPNQTLEGFIQDVNRLADLGPDSIFVYRMRLRREMEMQNRFWSVRDKLTQPPIEDIIAMQFAANKVLTENGYKQVSNAQWSKLDKAYGMDRWGERVPLFGFGWKAYSLFTTGETYNTEGLNQWCELVKDGKITAERAVQFGPEEEELVWTLFNLKFLRLDAQRFEKTFGKPLISGVAWSRITNLINIGLLQKENDGTVIFSETGRVIPEEVIQYVGLK